MEIKERGRHELECEECKAQVLELIEREVVDPEGVREVLARCPECRAEFDALKAALAVARRLPQEAPPFEADASILRAAKDRAAKRGAASGLRSRLRYPSWAAAAAALLAIGVGLSAWSASERSGVKPSAPSQRSPRAPLAATEPEAEVEETEPDWASEQARLRQPTRRVEEPAARRAGDAAGSNRELYAKKTISEEAHSAAASQGLLGPRSAQVASSSREPKIEPAIESSAAAAAEDDALDIPPEACRLTIRVFEARLRESEGDVPSPQEQLEAGLCYKALGAPSQARAWLERAAEHPSTKERAQEALKALK